MLPSKTAPSGCWNIAATRETDWRPVRVELAAPGVGWVDLHPVVFDEVGYGRQADSDGGCFDYPPDAFSTGRLGGAGVPCLARSLAGGRRAVCLNADDWMTGLGIGLFDSAVRDRVEQHLIRLAAELLALGVRVVVEFGSWSRAERDQLLAVGRDAGADVELHVLDPGVEELWRRLSARNSQSGETPIDRPTLQRCLGQWEPPDQSELARYDPHLAGA